MYYQRMSEAAFTHLGRHYNGVRLSAKNEMSVQIFEALISSGLHEAITVSIFYLYQAVFKYIIIRIFIKAIGLNSAFNANK